MVRDKDKLMRTDEVCRYLKISLRTLYRMIQQGRLPAIKLGHQWRFRFGEISKFLVNRALTRPRYFKPDALKQYLDYPEKYEVKEDSQGGWLGLQTVYVTELIKQGKRSSAVRAKRVTADYSWQYSAKAELPDYKEVFARIRFHRVKIKTGEFILMILPDEFNQLPDCEQRGWVYYQIT